MQLFLFGDLRVSSDIPFCHVCVHKMLVEPVETLEISSMFQLLCFPRKRTQFILSYLLLLYLCKLPLETFILIISELIKLYLVFLFLHG